MSVWNTKSSRGTGRDEPAAGRPPTSTSQAAATSASQAASPSGSHVLTGARTAERPAADSSGPAEHEIRLRAYEIYVNRKGAAGSPAQDWDQARRELTQRDAGRRGSGA